MIEDRIVYLNGDYVLWDKATVHMMCHSFGRTPQNVDLNTLLRWIPRGLSPKVEPNAFLW